MRDLGRSRKIPLTKFLKNILFLQMEKSKLANQFTMQYFQFVDADSTQPHRSENLLSKVNFLIFLSPQPNPNKFTAYLLLSHVTTHY